MENKMDKYNAVPAFVLEQRAQVPDNVRIFRLKWVWGLKKEPDSEKLQCTARLCVVGVNMDAGEFPSYSEVATPVALNILAAVFATHMEDFIAQQDDDSDAFQNTVTDGSDGDKAAAPMYTHQAPGFEKKGINGEQLVYRHRVAFQGRIDSPRLYGQKVKPLLAQAGWHATLFDTEAFIYHEGPTKGTAAKIPEILEAIRTAAPSPPGHAPVGFGLMVRHVDDRIKIVTSDRITQYQLGVFQHVYAMKTTAWRKVLGWTAVVDREERTVTFECPGVLLAAGDKFLKGVTFANNKHAMLPSLMQLEVGVAPDEADPEYPKFMQMQKDFRSLQGLMIWITQRYTQGLFLTRKTGQFHHSPSWDAYRHLCFGLMHLIAKPHAIHYGGKECRSLELATPIKQPITLDEKIWGLYWFCDASMGDEAKPDDFLAMTGAVGMLAGGAIDPVCQRQHQKAAEAHTTEIVAGGTALHRVMFAREMCREWCIGAERPTPIMFDSQTTIFVANDETAIKRSIWIRRRSAILREGVDDGEIEPVKIDQSLNAADVLTKYLVFAIWKRHVWWMHNLNAARCERADTRMRDARAAHQSE